MKLLCRFLLDFGDDDGSHFKHCCQCMHWQTSLNVQLICAKQVVVSPDVGGVARARAFAKKLNDAPLAIVDKRRSAHNVSEVMNLIGDVEGKVAVLVDDMIDTAGASHHIEGVKIWFLELKRFNCRQSLPRSLHKPSFKAASVPSKCSWLLQQSD